MPQTVLSDEAFDTFPEVSLTSRNNRHSDVVIRAADFDNIVSANKLVTLFKKHYGENYPFASVYDTNFWNSGLRNDDNDTPHLCSIVADDGKRFLAHLALLQRDNNTRAELLFPAIRPSFRSSLFTLSRLFSEQIHKTAERQQWRSISYFNYTSQPQAQIIAARCFSSLALALIPHHLSQQSSSHRTFGPLSNRRSLLLTGNFYPNHIPESRTLHAPACHRKIIAMLYKPLGLNRRFSKREQSLLAKNLPDSLPPTTTPLAEPNAVRHETFSIAELKVFPSTVSDLQKTQLHIDRIDSDLEAKQTRLIVKLALTDSSCPAFCEMLEAAGFRFCGVMPEEDGHDFLLLSRYRKEELEDLSLFTPRARALRDYMAAL